MNPKVSCTGCKGSMYAALLFLLLVSCAAYGQSSLDEAKQLMNDEQYKKALKLVTHDIDQHGLTEENALLKCEILLNVDQDAFFESIQSAIRAFPQSSRAYHIRAHFYYLIRDLPASIDDETKALAFCATDSIRKLYLLTRSGYYSYNNQVASAIADCREAQKISPDDINVLNNLSMSLFSNGETDESIRILESMKSIDKTSTMIYINLGFQNQELGRYDEAERHLLEGIAIDARDAYLWNNLGYVQHKLGKTQEGIKCIEKAIKMDPSNSYCYRNLALIYFDLHDKDKCCEQIQKSLMLGYTELYGADMVELSKKTCL